MQRKLKTMVSPVSTQVLPVVVTALTLKPEKVILLTTPKVETFTRLIRNALSFAGIEVQERTINPYSFASVKESVKDLQSPFLLLNCGTKFTAISLYRIFKGENTYYYTPDGRVISFNGDLLVKVPSNIVDVELHSSMYGFEIVEERQDYKEIEGREKLTRYIAQEPTLPFLLSKLYNEKKLKSLPESFVKLAEKANVIAYRGGEYVALKREYVGGKWLEEFTFLELQRKGFFDVRIGVKVKWYEEDVVNEIDVMATKNNQLYIFSCKTGRHLKDIVRHLYELEELTERIGGDFGRSFLVIPENLYKTDPPDRNNFPNIPLCSYKENPAVWKSYYKTKEGKRYRKARGNYMSFKNLLKRAELLGIKVLTPKLLEGGKWENSKEGKYT
jgi:hypothetical protein